MIYRYVAAALLTAVCSQAPAMSVQFAGGNSSELTCINDGTTSCEVVLQVLNDSEADAQILSWQLDLQLSTQLGAQGSISFEDVQTPPDSLFGPSPGPQPLILLGSNVIAIDADLESIEGKTILPSDSRHIVLLPLHLESNTAGRFTLNMLKYDPTDDSGSSWFDGGVFAPAAFTNPMNNEQAYQLVGEIVVLTVPEPTAALLLLSGGVAFVVRFGRRKRRHQLLRGSSRARSHFHERPEESTE